MKFDFLQFDEVSASIGMRGPRGASQSVQVRHSQHVLSCRPVREVARLLEIYKLLSNADYMLLTYVKLLAGDAWSAS